MSTYAYSDMDTHAVQRRRQAGRKTYGPPGRQKLTDQTWLDRYKQTGRAVQGQDRKARADRPDRPIDRQADKWSRKKGTRASGRAGILRYADWPAD